MDERPAMNGIDIQKWLEHFVDAVQETFGTRVVLIGIQGSYGRNEATPESDLDVVVLLDELKFDDLLQYKKMLAPLPYREKICGFVSGMSEIVHWEKSDLFQFCHDTIPLVGDLDFLISRIEKSDVLRAVRIGACNIYHTCCHNVLHETDLNILASLYKTAFFVLQAKYYYETNIYCHNKVELKQRLALSDLEIIERGSQLKILRETQDEEVKRDPLRDYSETLYRWSADLIKRC